MDYPFFGSRRMAVTLEVNRKRIQRLMRILGIEALYPKPNLSRPAAGHEIYPYLLRGVKIERPNQVWSTDITYIPMHGGFLYLVAVMDWYSRFVLSWELSNTMETGFCLAALEEAFRFGQPEIWNSDQGAQFTSADFLAPLKKRGISISIGWPRTRPGQCFYRTPMAQFEVRAHLSRRLRQRGGPAPGVGSLLPLLQPSAPAPGARLPHAGRPVPAPVNKEKAIAMMGALVE
jgi:transposase InsO family protein